MPRRDAVAKAATPSPRPANWLLAVPVFGSLLPFERSGTAGCWAGACEWFKTLEIEALSDKLAEALALSLNDVLTETLCEAESLAVPEFDTLPEPLLVLAEWKPPPGLVLFPLCEVEILLLKLVLTDAESLTLVLNDTLADAESFPPALLAELEAPIEAEMLLLKLVESDTDALADAFATLADADWLALTLVLTDAESLADAFAALADAD